MNEVTNEASGSYTITLPAGQEKMDVEKYNAQFSLCADLEQKWLTCVNTIKRFSQHITDGHSTVKIRIPHSAPYPVEFKVGPVLALLRKQAEEYKAALETAETSYCTFTRLEKDQEVA